MNQSKERICNPYVTPDLSRKFLTWKNNSLSDLRYISLVVFESFNYYSEFFMSVRPATISIYLIPVAALSFLIMGFELSDIINQRFISNHCIICFSERSQMRI